VLQTKETPQQQSVVQWKFVMERWTGNHLLRRSEVGRGAVNMLQVKEAPPRHSVVHLERFCRRAIETDELPCIAIKALQTKETLQAQSVDQWKILQQ